MKDVLKIVIFALALVGLVTLIVHLHWLGAIGVAVLVVKEIKPVSGSADRVVAKVQEWWDKRHKKEEM